MKTSTHQHSATLTRLLDHPLLSQTEEQALGRLAHTGDAAAIDRLVMSNIRLVAGMAGKYVTSRVSFDDLLGCGVVGLRTAAERYDPARGRFAVYAAWFIKQQLKNFIAKFGRGVVTIQQSTWRAADEVRRIKFAMSEKHGREATDDEVAEEMGCSAWSVARLQNLTPVDLDAPLSASEQSGGSLHEILPHEGCDYAETFEGAEILGQVMATLDDREREIIRARFGLAGEPETLESLGERLGVTRERVRQIEREAMLSMRRIARRLSAPELLVA